MTLYRSFQIDNRFNIFKDGKQVFTAHWQNCLTLKESMQLIDTSLAFNRLPDKQAALSKWGKEPDKEQDRSDFADKVNNYFENQLNESYDN